MTRYVMNFLPFCSSPQASARRPAAPRRRSFLPRWSSRRRVPSPSGLRQEIRRYVYLRTASLLPIVADPARVEGGLIVVGSKDRPAVKGFLDDASLKASVEGLAAEQYLLRSIRHRGRDVVLVAGGDSTGTLYAAYRLAERPGRSLLPRRRRGAGRPDPAGPAALDEVGRPLFDRRGIQPFHDFPEGPDWWNRDDYMAVLASCPSCA